MVKHGRTLKPTLVHHDSPSSSMDAQTVPRTRTSPVGEPTASSDPSFTFPIAKSGYAWFFLRKKTQILLFKNWKNLGVAEFSWGTKNQNVDHSSSFPPLKMCHKLGKIPSLQTNPSIIPRWPVIFHFAPQNPIKSNQLYINHQSITIKSQ